MTDSAKPDSSRKVLVVDIGGNNVKIMATGHGERRRISSGPDMTPELMVRSVKELAADWEYEVISIGCPGPVRDGALTENPAWEGRPVRSNSRVCGANRASV